MATFQGDLTTRKTAVNTDWTSKTAPSSISPTNGGGNVESFIQTIKDLGLDGDLSTVIYTLFNFYVGTSGSASTLLENNAVTVRGAANTLRAKLADNGGTGQVTLRDGTSNFEIMFSGAPFSVPLTANRSRYVINATGSEVVRVANSDLTAQTAAVASLATFTAPAAHTTFYVSGYVNITTIGTAVLNFNVNFTDINNVNRNIVCPATSVTSAAPIAAMAAGDYYAVLPLPFRAKASTAITASIVIVSGSGETFDCGATITQLT